MPLHQFTLDEAELTDAVIRAPIGGLPRRIGNAGHVPDMIAANPTFLFLQPFENSLADVMGGPAAEILGAGAAFAGPSALDGSRYLVFEEGGYLRVPRTGLCRSDRAWSMLWRQFSNIPADGEIAYWGNTNYGCAGIDVFYATGLGKIGVQIVNANLSVADQYFTAPIPFIGFWREYLLTYDGSGTTAGLHLYIDGVECAPSPTHYQPGLTGAAGDSPLGMLFNSQGNPGHQHNNYFDLIAYREDVIDPATFLVSTAQACWYWTPDKDAMIRSFIVPGTDGDAGVDIEVGAAPPVHVNGNSPDLAIAVPAGTTVKICTDITGDKYIGSDLGNGPALIYDEALAVRVIESLTATVEDRTALTAFVEE